MAAFSRGFEVNFGMINVVWCETGKGGNAEGTGSRDFGGQEGLTNLKCVVISPLILYEDETLRSHFMRE